MTLEQAQQYFADGQQPPETESASDEHLRALADTLPEIVWSARPDGGVDYCNARWYEFTGSRLEAGSNESWRTVLHPDDVEPFLEEWHRAMGTGTSLQIECRLRERCTGGYRWHLARTFPVKNARGRVTQWMGTCTDIHEHKEASRALEQHIAALSAADRRKDEFLAMIAHELRSPLASIANAAASLCPGESEQRGWAAGVIARQTAQLTRLIEDLLDVAGLNNGKIQLRKEPLDLATVLDNAVETSRPAIAEHRHELRTDYPHGHLFLEADPVRLEQIVINLLTNAAKYTPDGGHISLHARREGGWLAVIVKDDGWGISPEKLSEIFIAFKQGEPLTAPSTSGLGLGLTIVRKLTELHAGTVSAASAGADKGCEFMVRLPAGDTVPIAPRPPRAPVVFGEPSRARLLVVDDHADSADSLARLLRRRGYRLKIAHDGAAALAAAGAFQPQVVLLDINLPGMDGCEVASRLRQNPAHRNCLLIAFSENGQEEERRRCLEAGFDRHFLKPIDWESLHDFISDCLAKREDESRRPSERAR